mgnify:CR=1 FL=1
MALLIDGKIVSENIKNELKKEVNNLLSYSLNPKFAIICVGNNEESLTYVKNKVKTANSVGINVEVINLSENTSEEKIIEKIEILNKDKTIHGIIVQMPLPPHLNEKKITCIIDPKKDIDCFHPYNIGKLVLGDYNFIPATPLGIIELIKYYNIETEGKNVTVIGRSNIVGRPISILLSQKNSFGNANVVILHSRSNNLSFFTLISDIIIVAVGKPKFLTADMIKNDSVIIDVGINYIDVDGKRKLVGDVDFENVKNKVKMITPVPGGVGPMTVVCLLKNLIKAVKLQNNLA